MIILDINFAVIYYNNYYVRTNITNYEYLLYEIFQSFQKL